MIAAVDRSHPVSAGVGERLVSVVVVDDHPLYRAAMAATVRGCPALDLVAECGDGRAALDTIMDLAPDVALLDVRLPELDGLEVLQAMVHQQSRTRVVFLSAQLEASRVFEILAAGAGGVLSKIADEPEVIDAILTVADGGTVIAKDLQQDVVREIQIRTAHDRDDLSARERKILQMVAEGNTAQEIAQRLHLATPTVKAHLQQLYRKLEVSDRAAAVATGLRRGLIE